ncbi:hypothetical protein GCM10027446_15170 [Angustibacter peucedani]
MDDDDQRTTRQRPRWYAPAAIGAAGLVMGAVLAGTLSANAADTTTPTPGASSSASGEGAPPGGGARDESKSQRPDETLLTGTTADKVRAAALAKYPGATVLRVETDSDGVYEAHLTTSDGQRVTVEVDKSFAVTGTEQGGGQGGGAPGGGAAPSGTATSGT